MTKQAKVINLERSGESDVLTPKEAAAFLRMSKSHLLRILSGEVDAPPIRHLRAGKRKLLFRRAWLLEYLERAAQEK